jgi:hypothetical protein
MAAWIKVLGSGREPLDDGWQTAVHPGFDETFVAGRKRQRRMMRGDQIAFYAAGWKVVFAIGTVEGSAYESDDADWPWRVDVKLDSAHTVEFIHEGVPLRDASVGDRNLLRSIQSKSHFELTAPEFEAIKAGLQRTP